MHTTGLMPAVLMVLMWCSMIGQPLLQSLQVFFGVGIGQRQPGHNLGAAAVHLQRPDGGDEHRHVWFKAAVSGI